MERINSDAHTHVEAELSSAMHVSAPRPLNIRWGRTLVAVVGVFALLTAGISTILNMFNIGSAALSWTGLIVFVAVLAGLRALAVRDQNLRRSSSPVASTTPTSSFAVPVRAAGEQRETALFDRAAGIVAEPAPEQKRLTPEELRNAALRVAAKGTAEAKLAHTQTIAEGELEAETWEPVEVPVPGYVTAARAASQEVPLEVPVAPKSAGTSIKADQAGIAAPTSAPVVVPGGKPETAAPGDSVVVAKTAKANNALNNLDDVLQRRRA